MNSVPSYTVDRETAATLREWLFENAVEKHGEPEISETLVDLAAAIDGVLYEETEAIELGAWAQTVPPSHRTASHVDGNLVDEYRPDDARDQAKPDASIWASASQIVSTTRSPIRPGSSITISPRRTGSNPREQRLTARRQQHRTPAHDGNITVRQSGIAPHTSAPCVATFVR